MGKFLKKSFWSKSWVNHICQQLLISEHWICDPLPSTLPKLHTSQSQATSRVSISSVTLGSFDLLFNAWWSRYITYASVIACFCIFTMFSDGDSVPFQKMCNSTPYFITVKRWKQQDIQQTRTLWLAMASAKVNLTWQNMWFDYQNAQAYSKVTLA